MISNETLFEQAVSRVSGQTEFAQPLVIAGAAHADLIEDQLAGADHARLIIEPAAKNTAPPIALAAAMLPRDAVMLVCPSDHHIADPAAFRTAALSAATLAEQDYLVAFGITPTRPETGYGYLENERPLSGGFAIKRFVEKPDQARAQDYFASGQYSWNGGIFAFRAGYLLAELAAHRPKIANLVNQAITSGRKDERRSHPAAASFAAIAGESIDYAVMENTNCAAMVPVGMGWSDIGSWATLADALADISAVPAKPLSRR